MTEIKQDIVRDLMRVAYAWADEPVCPVSGRSGALEIAIRDALRAGKSQAVEQGEAVAPFCMHWVDRWGCNHYADQKEPHPANATPLFTHPVRPMSDEEAKSIYRASGFSLNALVRRVEAFHGIRGATE